MKMKKLLAGVLSAAMVATMIPASMAFSSVSAAETNEDSFVAYYDFTAGETSDWSASNTGNIAISVDDKGVHTTAFNGQAFTIDNPLQSKASEGFTVVLTVSNGWWNPGTTLFSFAKSSNLQANYDGFLTVMSDAKSVHLNPYDGDANGYWDYYIPAAAYEYNDPSTIVLTGNSEGGFTLYKDGVVQVSFEDTAAVLAGVKALPDADSDGNLDGSVGGEEYVKAVAEWVNTMPYFTLGTGSFWGNELKTYESVAFYDAELSADQVKNLNPEADREAYAKSIADSLNLRVIGMQKGTFTPTDGVATQATRFVANLNSEALANDAITMLGWAAEANATTEITNPETATYASVTTVTNDSTLAPEGTFAYTYVVTDGAQTGVVPCVQVTVGGVEFWFSYNGYSGSLESTVDGTNDCQVVAAIEVPDAAFTSTQA